MIARCPNPCASTCRLALTRGPYRCAIEFALAHPDGAPLDEVGALLGVSSERARQIETSALIRFVRGGVDAGLFERARRSRRVGTRSRVADVVEVFRAAPPTFEHACGGEPFASSEDES